MAAAIVTRRRALGLLAAATLTPLARGQQTLYEQSLARTLGPPAAGTEFLLLSLRGPSTGRPLVDRFARSHQPIPVGSLLKPFLVPAFKQSQSTFPVVTCRGRADRCWSLRGHGSLTLPQALAQSCNAYFLTLARGLRVADVPYLPDPPAGATPETLIGLTPQWPIAPLALARAYAELLTAPATPALAAVREGMRLCATHGTAARIGLHRGGVLAKTGTAPCIDLPCRASGDGLVIASVPAPAPALLLLVRRRATTGAATAVAAGTLLAQLERLHEY